MDANRFDSLAVALFGSRRTALRAVLAAAAVGLFRRGASLAIISCHNVGKPCRENGDCCGSSICDKKKNAERGVCRCKNRAQECATSRGLDCCSPQEVCSGTCDAGCCPRGKTTCCIGRRRGPFCGYDGGTCCGDKSCLPEWVCCANDEKSKCCAPLETCCSQPDGKFICCPVGVPCLGGQCGPCDAPCGNECCTEQQRCCPGHGCIARDACCPSAGLGAEGACCPPDQPACGFLCCNAGETCCQDTLCCPQGTECRSGSAGQAICCVPGRLVCGGGCCSADAGECCQTPAGEYYCCTQGSHCCSTGGRQCCV
jgi:hypothetical protein